MVDMFLPSYDELLSSISFQNQNEKFGILGLDWNKNNFGFIRFVNIQ